MQVVHLALTATSPCTPLALPFHPLSQVPELKVSEIKDVDVPILIEEAELDKAVVDKYIESLRAAAKAGSKATEADVKALFGDEPLTLESSEKIVVKDQLYNQLLAATEPALEALDMDFLAQVRFWLVACLPGCRIPRAVVAGVSSSRSSWSRQPAGGAAAGAAAGGSGAAGLQGPGACRGGLGAAAVATASARQRPGASGAILHARPLRQRREPQTGPMRREQLTKCSPQGQGGERGAAAHCTTHACSAGAAC